MLRLAPNLEHDRTIRLKEMIYWNGQQSTEWLCFVFVLRCLQADSINLGLAIVIRNVRIDFCIYCDNLCSVNIAFQVETVLCLYWTLTILSECYLLAVKVIFNGRSDSIEWKSTSDRCYLRQLEDCTFDG